MSVLSEYNLGQSGRNFAIYTRNSSSVSPESRLLFNDSQLFTILIRVVPGDPSFTICELLDSSLRFASERVCEAAQYGTSRELERSLFDGARFCVKKNEPWPQMREKAKENERLL
jgi:hypothetical protein